MYDEVIVCPSCNSDNTLPYNDAQIAKNLVYPAFDWLAPNGEDTLKLGRDSSLCPKCGDFTLNFDNVGCWDQYRSSSIQQF